ncbi:hypothetical protein SEA_ROSIEPOSIE_41 [Arthrobacter phage RosiePosie]|uniref:Uncharacterized protein n=8 Tax=Klausavirus princesstrina TaxID=1984784 RepID=A0A286N454_9CAUD|nr:hypothetical protein SEA_HUMPTYDUMPTY_41 [Arthrobacter phage HumptyDumpty]ASX98826.1 hypothetical protein SEA_KABREEZE_41 [Arthrobacter phage Kabreeze]ASX98937.1 hypothetical protein SEA_ROSIEPOSIE_41 [Arthrobacter phage RosiePosie]ASX99049.1 hypothetical protein SEA_SCAVITO_41 [Arthrobacter phage Scavito]ASX99161.1 hypothetical protein SEA_TOPHAT_41 [Arthrobacter phage Tophat]ASZ73252.1 hypothetical protein SEA_JAYCOOKIE_41 [Arthrobacter phage JayCookie]QBP30412.1 hypothetical protein SEA
MSKLRLALARFARWFAGASPVPAPEPPRSRLEELHDQRLQGVFQRGMAALESRPANMTDRDREILGHSIANMLARNVAS